MTHRTADSEGPMQPTRPTFWTPVRLAEARAEYARLGPNAHKVVARVLAERWCVALSRDSLRNAMRASGWVSPTPRTEPVPPPPEPEPEEEPLDPDLPPQAVDPRPAPAIGQPAVAHRHPGASDRPHIQAPPPSGLPVEELVEHRKRRYEQRLAHERARALIPVTVRDDLPIGLLHFGDPHVDDDGCDLSLLQRHCQIVRETPGLWATTVGDLTNNWVGRLVSLYGQQATTESEAWQIAEAFIGKWIGDRWLYLVGGNHDSFSGVGDPLLWITRQAGALYQSDEARVELRFPGGSRVRINCRHDFPGRSIYNEAHGPLRWLLMNQRDHLAIAGHTHVSSHHVLKAPESGITMHAMRVAAYKTIDSYARSNGFADKHLSPCVLTVIDPRLPPEHPDLIKAFWDPEEGAAYLTFLRSRARRRVA